MADQIHLTKRDSSRNLQEKHACLDVRDIRSQFNTTHVCWLCHYVRWCCRSKTGQAFFLIIIFLFFFFFLDLD